MLDSRSIRSISKELGLSTKTVFDWRHKVLGSFQNIFTKEYRGIVETDSVFFRFSQKGRKKDFVNMGRKKRGINNQQVSVLFTMDRYRTYDFRVMKLGKMDVEGIDRVIDKSRFNKENVVCSDSEWSLINVFKEMGLDHKTFKSGLGVYGLDGVYHVNNLNNVVSRIRGWVLGNFRSISTKYLGNYLNWFAMMEILKDRDRKGDKMWDYILMDSNSFGRNRKVEESYRELLMLSGIK